MQRGSPGWSCWSRPPRQGCSSESARHSASARRAKGFQVLAPRARSLPGIMLLNMETKVLPGDSSSQLGIWRAWPWDGRARPAGRPSWFISTFKHVHLFILFYNGYVIVQSYWQGQWPKSSQILTFHKRERCQSSMILSPTMYFDRICNLRALHFAK